jgi:hypothetical protein
MDTYDIINFGGQHNVVNTRDFGSGGAALGRVYTVEFLYPPITPVGGPAPQKVYGIRGDVSEEFSTDMISIPPTKLSFPATHDGALAAMRATDILNAPQCQPEQGGGSNRRKTKRRKTKRRKTKRRKTKRKGMYRN